MDSLFPIDFTCSLMSVLLMHGLMSLCGGLSDMRKVSLKRGGYRVYLLADFIWKSLIFVLLALSIISVGIVGLYLLFQLESLYWIAIPILIAISSIKSKSVNKRRTVIWYWY